MTEIAVVKGTEDEAAIAAPHHHRQDITWTTTECTHGTVCLRFPALLPHLSVTRTSIPIVTPTICGPEMIPMIDCPHEIIHLPPEGTHMAPHFEETPMIIIPVLCLPRRDVGEVFHHRHRHWREEGRLSTLAKKVCLIWKSLWSIGHKGEKSYTCNDGVGELNVVQVHRCE